MLLYEKLLNKKTVKEKIFKLLKIRSMTCEKDSEGNLLLDEKRLAKYGKILRSTSLDELPELFNIFIGSMPIVSTRPVLTGLAQINDRNAFSWYEKFSINVKYVNSISLWRDCVIFFKTVLKVFRHDGINFKTDATLEEFNGNSKG